MHVERYNLIGKVFMHDISGDNGTVLHAFRCETCGVLIWSEPYAVHTVDGPIQKHDDWHDDTGSRLAAVPMHSDPARWPSGATFDISYGPGALTLEICRACGVTDLEHIRSVQYIHENRSEIPRLIIERNVPHIARDQLYRIEVEEYKVVRVTE